EKEITTTETLCEECAHELETQEFKPTHCRLTIKSIRHANLPALDESLAKKAGCDSVERLLERVQKDLIRQADEHAKNHQRSQIKKDLLDQYDFDIPLSLTEREKKNLMRMKINELKHSKLSPELFAEKSKEIEEEITHKLENEYKLIFLVR